MKAVGKLRLIPVTITLNADEIDLLSKMAEIDRKTRARFIRELVRKYLQTARIDNA